MYQLTCVFPLGFSFAEYVPRHHVERRDVAPKLNNRELRIVTIQVIRLVFI